MTVPATGSIQVARRTIVFYREVMLALSIVTASAGMTLMARSGLGISVMSSVPYVFSLHFTQISFGTWSFISYMVVIMLTCLLTRHFEKLYHASLLISFFCSVANDLFKYIWSFLPDGVVLQLLYYPAGLLLLSAGIAGFIHSGLPPAPYELIVRELERFKGIPVARGKTIMDLTSLTISLLFIAFVLHRLVGIGPGTVIAGLLNGTLIGFWIRQMKRWLVMESLFWQKKSCRTAERRSRTPSLDD